jgi:hypothetical protein
MVATLDAETFVGKQQLLIETALVGDFATKQC